MFTLAYEWNEMKYVWMNEVDSVFAKEGSLVEVPYVEPSFFLKSLCQVHDSKVSWHMNEWYEKCYVLYAICYVLSARCYMQTAIW